MVELQIPFSLRELPVKPEFAGRIKIDETVIQTLAALLAYDGEGRRLLRCSPGGVLAVASNRIKGVYNHTATGPNEAHTPTSIKCSEVIVRAGLNNTGLIWVKPDEAAGVDDGYPLASGEVWQFTIDDISNVRSLIVTSGDKLIIVYTR